MSSSTSTSGPDRDELRPLQYFTSRSKTYFSDPTFRRKIRAGRLPRRKIGDTYHFSINEVLAAKTPIQKSVPDDLLRQWAEARAAEAGPLSNHQIELATAAFASALKAGAPA